MILNAKWLYTRKNIQQTFYNWILVKYSQKLLILKLFAGINGFASQLYLMEFDVLSWNVNIEQVDQLAEINKKERSPFYGLRGLSQGCI